MDELSRDTGSESHRLAALAQYDILDTPAEVAFDDLVQLAAQACDAPVALISLVTDDRQWFKARVGFEGAQTDLNSSVCVHALDAPDVLVIPDLSIDPRTAANPLVTGEEAIRFYAGAPLRTADGIALGSLCVIDFVPRPDGLDPQQAETLAALGRQVVANLELRRMVRDREIAILDQEAERHRIATSEAQWRRLFDNLGEGFILGEVVRDAAGEIVDWRYVEVNAAWHWLVGIEPGTAKGRTIREVFPQIEDEWVMEFAGVVTTGVDATFTRQVGTSRRWYDGRCFRLSPDRFAVIFRETTTERLKIQRQDAMLRIGDAMRECDTVAEMSRIASEIAGTTLDVTRASFGRVDENTEFVDIEPDWTAPGVRSIAGRHRFADYGDISAGLARGEALVIEDVHSDPRTAAEPTAMLDRGICSLVNMPVRDRGRTVAVFVVHDSDPRRWTDDELTFLRNVADRLEAGVARIHAEERQHLLNQELAHRLKNTLAMVQAIAIQTLRGHADRAPFDAFEARLQALAAAHDVLLQQQWVSADMTALIRSVLATFAEADRIAIDGPDIALGTRSAMSTSLVINELATNACKYGALSVSGGTVEITWRVEDDDRLVFDWIERDGPPATPPTRRGFGSKLLRLGLVGTGNVDLNYERHGFSATMTAPIAELLRS